MLIENDHERQENRFCQKTCVRLLQVHKQFLEHLLVHFLPLANLWNPKNSPSDEIHLIEKRSLFSLKRQSRIPWYIVADQMLHTVASFKFLHSFSRNRKSEYNAVKSVTCKSVAVSMVTYDFDCTPYFVIELI